MLRFLCLCMDVLKPYLKWKYTEHRHTCITQPKQGQD